MKKQFELSLIIPTKNRASFLSDTLQSILDAYCDNIYAECIVVDNGSTDTTQAIVESFIKSFPFPLRYAYEPCPGLHVGRNLGAQLAKASIVCYLDDDIFMQAGWFEAVIESFTHDTNIALVGGPCLPHFEKEPPAWFDNFKTYLDENGWAYIPFSLISLGDKGKYIPSEYVFGCNYCIKKEIVFKADGFHPDGMPLHLIKYRGDGETGMGVCISKMGLKTWYNPKVAILHRIPASRMTLKYIKGTAQRSAISHVYTVCREKHVSFSYLFRSFKVFMRHVRKNIFKEKTELGSHAFWYNYHVFQHILRIFISPSLRKWVTKKDYLNKSEFPY